MTSPAATITATDGGEPEFRHPDWCHDFACTTNPDGTITHRHLMGRVDDVALVFVTRTDSTDDHGKRKTGPTVVVVEVPRATVTPSEVTRLNRLTQQAAVFAGQRMDRG